MSTACPTVLLHIGTMKSGTTYLQDLLWASRARLLEAGVLVPGRREGEQGHAARDVLHGETITDPAVLARTRGAWARLSAEMLAFPGRSIFSMEFLSFADEKRARHVLDSLADADVHVVLTVRDARRTLPAQWQTMCRTGRTIPWPRFVASVAAAVAEDRFTGPAAHVFRRTQHVPRMLAAWGTWVPPPRLHVVTVQASGSDPRLLWRRFASVLDVDPDVAVAPPSSRNPSLGYPSAELMRRMNLRLGGFTQFDYNHTLKSHLAPALERRAHVEPRTPLDLPTHRLATRWNQVVREAVAESGAHVVGDLDDLPVGVSPAHAADAVPDLRPPTGEELLAAAAPARDTLVAVIGHRVRRLETSGVPAPAPAEPLDLRADAPTRPDRWAGADRPVRSAVTELAGLAGHAMTLRRLFEPGSVG